MIAVAPARASIRLQGCLSDSSWCDGTFQGQRGWFSARYLEIAGGSVPVVAFDIDSYWGHYYRERPFYVQLSVYASGGSGAIEIGSFYRPLAPHGRWVLVKGRYVWAPRVPRGWRPYTEGRWVYTHRYGWMWVSHEPFGWATYHYGRWAYSPTIGWFWVPGTRWAPAWVAWRQSDDYLVWAPLPPDPADTFGISIDISFGDIPNYYWRAVPTRDFQSTNLANVVIGDNNQIINIVNQTEAIGNVTVVNNVVVNNVVNIEFVEEKTEQQVVAHNVALTSDTDASAEVEGETIEVYHPAVSALPADKEPPEVARLEEVARESQTVGQSGDEPATEDRVPPPPSPDQAPPEVEAPPMVGEETPADEQITPGQEQAPGRQQAPCAEGTERQVDGRCAEPAAAPEAPPAQEPAQSAPVEPAAPAAAAEQPAPQAPAAEPPSAPAPEQQSAPAPEPPADQGRGQGRGQASDRGGEASPQRSGDQQPAPAKPEAAPPRGKQPQQVACPEGQVFNSEGACVPPGQQ